MIGEALMISAGDKKVAAKRRKKKTPFKEEKAEKKPEAEEKAKEKAPAEEVAIPQEFIPMMNAPAGLDRLNLLGRQVKIAVRDKNGEVIALSGQRITPEILSLARKNNLLLRLTVNTLTNIV